MNQQSLPNTRFLGDVGLPVRCSGGSPSPLPSEAKEKKRSRTSVAEATRGFQVAARVGFPPWLRTPRLSFSLPLFLRYETHIFGVGVCGKSHGPNALLLVGGADVIHFINFSITGRSSGRTQEGGVRTWEQH